MKKFKEGWPVFTMNGQIIYFGNKAEALKHDAKLKKIQLEIERLANE